MNGQILFYDIYDYYYPAWWKQPAGIILIILAALLVISIIVLIIWLKKKKSLSPEQCALRDIERLQPSKCIIRQDFKKFYFALTALVKQYFAKGYAWDVTDKTDDEFVVFLEKQAQHQAFTEIFKKIIQGAVEVKFANVDVIKSQAEEDWKNVKTFFVQEVKKRSLEKGSSRHNKNKKI